MTIMYFCNSLKNNVVVHNLHISFSRKKQSSKHKLEKYIRYFDIYLNNLYSKSFH